VGVATDGTEAAASHQIWPPLHRWPPDPPPLLAAGSVRLVVPPAWVASTAASALASWPWTPSCPMDPCRPPAAIASSALLRTGLSCRPPLDHHRFGFASVRLGVLHCRPGPTRHGIAHTLAIIGPAAPMSTGALGSPSSPLSLPPGLVEQMLLDISEDMLCSLADLDDEHLLQRSCCTLCM
jgi:hypothetical protein